VIALAFIDMAGTTVNDNGVVEKAVRVAVERTADVDTEGSEFRAGLRRARGASKIDMFRSLLGDAELAARAHEQFEDALEDAIAAGRIGAMPAAFDALTSLHEHGLKIALATGFTPRIRTALLEHLAWSDLVDLAVSPADAGRGRPYPDMILTAVVRLEIDAVQQVAVAGDTTNDLLAGARSGANVVAGVLGGAHTREELERAPHTHILDDISQLPHHVIASS
jgi:phosphoglycolate phosphatase